MAIISWGKAVTALAALLLGMGTFLSGLAAYRRRKNGKKEET